MEEEGDGVEEGKGGEEVGVGGLGGGRGLGWGGVEREGGDFSFSMSRKRLILRQMKRKKMKNEKKNNQMKEWQVRNEMNDGKIGGTSFDVLGDCLRIGFYSYGKLIKGSNLD